MDKAMRWAIASCEDTAEPVLTVFVLPWQAQKSTAYARWLCHPSVQEIKTIKRGNIFLAQLQSKVCIQARALLYIAAFFCIPNYSGIMSQLTTWDYVTKFESQRFRVQLS